MMVNVDLSALHNLGEGGLPNSHLTNGKHNIIKCNSCNKRLCDAWVTQPNENIKSIIKAHCDYCEGTSKNVEVLGKFHLGHTDQSNMINVQYEDQTPSDSKIIYQKIEVFTKRTNS